MKALIFDCDGVLADTERYGHLPAFNQIFEEFALPVRWSEEEYGRRLQIGGGKERIASLLTDEFVRAAGLPADAEGQQAALAEWHRRKTAVFKDLARSGRLPGRPGVARVIAEALESGWLVSVASTSAEESVRAVVHHVVGPKWAGQVAVYAGDIVPAKKPAPDIYELVVADRNLDPADTLVIEDSRNGLRAAVAAGLRCVVTVTSYTAGEDMSAAVLVVSSLGEPGEEPIEVLANRSHARPGAYLTLADLEDCMKA